MQPAETVITGPGGNELSVQGVLKTAISVNGKSATATEKFYVVDGAKQIILSYNAFEKLGMVKKCLK